MVRAVAVVLVVSMRVLGGLRLLPIRADVLLWGRG